MDCVAIVATGASIVTWTSPRDLTLRGAAASANSVSYVISQNPVLSAAQVLAGGTFDQLIAYVPTGAGTAPRGFIPFSFQLSKGALVYFAFSGAGEISLFYD